MASRNWREQYKRMKRAYVRAVSSPIGEEAADAYYAFFARCFHLKDWLKNDPLVSDAVGKAAEALVSGTKALSLCADLANGIKHLRADLRPRIDPDTRIEHVVEFERGEAEQLQTRDVLIVVSDQYKILWDAREVADACLQSWDCFLLDHGLQQDNRALGGRYDDPAAGHGTEKE